MAVYSEQILRSTASPESFRRGKQYVQDGAVENVSVTRDSRGDILVEGKVYGSVRYDTSVTIAADGSEVINYDCDCPYSQGGACKHVIALGIVGARRSVVAEEKSMTKAVDDPRLLEVLRKYADEHGKKLSDKELQDVATRLDGLMVHRGTDHLPPRRPDPIYHELDDISLSFHYDKPHDLIRVEAVAAYGPVLMPVCGFDQINETDDIYVADRDMIQERAAGYALQMYGFRPTRDAGIYLLEGSGARRFILEGLLALDEKYTIRVTDAFDAISRPKKVRATSDWNFGGMAKENWFEFSVNWKAEGRALTPDEIEQLAYGYDGGLRDEEGSYLEIENIDALKRYVKTVRGMDQKQIGKKNAVSLIRAFELAALAEETEGARIEQTESAVSSFLRDAKAGKLIIVPKIPSSFKKVLRPYQADGVAWALFLRRWGFGGVLADDMGLGKTLQALTILSTERPKGSGPSLVICPKTLISTWVAEAKRFAPNLKVLAIEGTQKERATALTVIARRHQSTRQSHVPDLLITSYSLFQRDVKLYREIDLYYAILDEAQYVKNAKTTTAVAVKTLKAQHRLALTGTPLENGVHELWSLFDFLMPGLLLDHREFREEFERPIREFNDNEALARLKRRVQPFLLRRTKETVAPELPPRIEQNDWCEMTPTQVSLYADVLASTRRDVFDAVEKKGFNRSRIEILAALTKLRQVCDHPVLVDKKIGRSEELSGKMAYALELVREAVDGGHKILLFSQFTSMLDILREGLDKMKIGHVTIEGKTRDRAAAVQQFREDKNTPVFLLSLRAAGTGLTLTEADTVVMYDPWWNPMVERQAMDRAHRIGQTKCVNVHKLVTKGTVEEKVLALQEKKKAVFDAVVSENTDGLKGLTWEDVKGMFDS